MTEEHEKQLMKIAEEQLNTATLGILGQLIDDHKNLKDKHKLLLNNYSKREEEIEELKATIKKNDDLKQSLLSKERGLEQLKLDLQVRETAISKREYDMDLHDAKQEIEHLKSFNDKLNTYNATLFANKSVHHMVNFSAYGSLPIPMSSAGSSWQEQHPFDVTGSGTKIKE